MKTRLTAFIGLLLVAALSLAVVAIWAKKMAASADPANIDNATYFLYTWIVTFVISAVAAVFVLIKMVTYKRRQHEHDHD